MPPITTLRRYIRHQLSMITSIITNAWYNPSPLRYWLIPFSWLYQIAALTKRWLYVSSGYKKQIRFSLPIIVVGNITVGGTGKTPLIIALAHLLSEHGYRPGIVSRGYGGKPSILPLHVTPQTNPAEAGDEPVLIAKKTQRPLVVSPKRVEAIQALIDTYDCDVILSDDGMQHYQMHRDIEISVVDGERRFGNTLCLPAGPLREPIHRLHSVDFIISQGKAAQDEYPMQLISGPIYSLSESNNTLDIGQAQKKPIHAVAGIGHPDRFFNQLKKLGFSVIPHPFPDHYAYQLEDITFNDDRLVIMTEKDAVKCKAFATDIHWCLPVIAQCPETFYVHLLDKLGKVVLHLGSHPK
jgi:tetraacyldisaccharide 4'-kinase